MRFICQTEFFVLLTNEDLRVKPENDVYIYLCRGICTKPFCLYTHAIKYVERFSGICGTVTIGDVPYLISFQPKLTFFPSALSVRSRLTIYWFLTFSYVFTALRFGISRALFCSRTYGVHKTQGYGETVYEMLFRQKKIFVTQPSHISERADVPLIRVRFVRQ